MVAVDIKIFFIRGWYPPSVYTMAYSENIVIIFCLYEIKFSRQLIVADIVTQPPMASNGNMLHET